MVVGRFMRACVGEGCQAELVEAFCTLRQAQSDNL